MLLKKWIVLGILIVMITVSFTATTGNVGASTKTWHVDDNDVEHPGADFDNIQDAVDAGPVKKSLIVFDVLVKAEDRMMFCVHIL